MESSLRTKDVYKIYEMAFFVLFGLVLIEPSREENVTNTVDICEVGLWGDHCEYQCNTSACDGTSCDKATGLCETCQVGYWGDICDKRCVIDNCIGQTDCDRVNGSFCQTCENYRWGSLCENECPQSCDGICTSTGKCSSCPVGFWGDVCNVTCKHQGKCKSCDQQTGACNECITGSVSYWGKHCERSCHIAHCAGPLLCTKDDGPTCFRCKTGKWGAKCEHTCHESCLGECSISDGKCLVYATKATVAESTKAKQPVWATLTITRSTNPITREEVFGIAFGTAILVCLIMGTLAGLGYRLYSTRFSMKFQRHEDDL